MKKVLRIPQEHIKSWESPLSFLPTWAYAEMRMIHLLAASGFDVTEPFGSYEDYERDSIVFVQDG